MEYIYKASEDVFKVVNMVVSKTLFIMVNTKIRIIIKCYLISVIIIPNGIC